MIVARKPWLLFDVDLIGLGSIAVVLAAGWWFVARPLQQTWHDYSQIATAYRAVQSALQEEITTLEHFQHQVAQFEDVVTTHADDVPTAVAFSDLLREMTDLAEANNLELLAVRPQPAKRNGAYTVSDVQVGGRGRSTDFIRFLDELAGRNPYQSLLSCTIRRAPTSDDPACELHWTTRLYLLAPEVPPSADETDS